MSTAARSSEHQRGRTRRGRYTSACRDDELIWLVAEAQRVQPGMPVTQALFDRLRPVLKHPDAPRAAQISRRFGLPWAEVVARAERSAEALSRALYARTAAPTLGGDPVARARWALRSVALQLGTDRMSQADYDRAREAAIAQAPTAQKPGLPTSNQLIKLSGGSWRGALALADVRPARRGRKPGIAFVDAIELCLHAHGALPTNAELYAFANANHVSITREKSFQRAIDELRLRRHREGRWTPPRPPPTESRPDYGRPLKAGTGRRVGRQKWTREHCIDALCEFLQWLSAHDPHGTPTHTRYNAWTSDRPNRPWGKTIIHHGGWNSLLAEARHRLMTGEPTRSDDERPLERLLEKSRKPHIELAIIDYAHERETFTIADVIRDLALSHAASDDRIRRLHSAGIIERTPPPARSDRRGHPLHHYRLSQLTEDLDRLWLLFASRADLGPAEYIAITRNRATPSRAPQRRIMVAQRQFTPGSGRGPGAGQTPSQFVRVVS